MGVSFPCTPISMSTLILTEISTCRLQMRECSELVGRSRKRKKTARAGAHRRKKSQAHDWPVAAGQSAVLVPVLEPVLVAGPAFALSLNIPSPHHSPRRPPSLPAVCSEKPCRRAYSARVRSITLLSPGGSSRPTLLKRRRSRSVLTWLSVQSVCNDAEAFVVSGISLGRQESTL